MGGAQPLFSILKLRRWDLGRRIGDKRMAPVEDYCYAMARRGYVVASTNTAAAFLVVMK